MQPAPLSMHDHAVQVDVTSPLRFDRAQLLVRLLIAITLGIVGMTANVVIGSLYVVLPAISAIVLSTGRGRYLDDAGVRLWRALAWLLRLSAFMMLLVDRFPTGDDGVRMTIQFSGKPSVGSSLAKLITSIPSAVVLGALWCISAVLSCIGVVTIIVARRVPHWILGFQRAVLRWQANLIAYHASLVEAYPPFALDTSERSPSGESREAAVPAGS